MDMQGNRLLSATQEQAWAALNNPDILKACIPGCEKFELTEENSYNVGVALRIGPVAAKFSGTVKLMDIQPPHSYALQFEAQGGVAGFGKGESKVSLTPHIGAARSRICLIVIRAEKALILRPSSTSSTNSST
jgi:carbon monoxide dehydrogenase subunit G